MGDPPAPATDDDRQLPQPPPASATPKPRLLDYPSKPANPELDSEPWPQVARAMLIVLGVMLSILFVFFGTCGVLVRGCG